MAQKYRVLAVDKLDQLVHLRGKKVLEIGGDAQLEVANLILDKGAAHVTTINYDPNFADRQVNEFLTVKNHDGTKLSECFKAGSFDVVFGVALIEHVHDLPLLLDQVFDVLTPDGTAVLKGSPIWTSDKGHHIFVKRSLRHYRFTVPEDNPIPPWYHLLLTREEMEAFLMGEKGIDIDDAKAIGHFIYEHPILSRRGYAEIIDAFRRTKFRSVRMEEIKGPAPDVATAKKLRMTRWWTGNRFDVQGFLFTLRKGRDIETLPNTEARTGH